MSRTRRCMAWTQAALVALAVLVMAPRLRRPRNSSAARLSGTIVDQARWLSFPGVTVTAVKPV